MPQYSLTQGRRHEFESGGAKLVKIEVVIARGEAAHGQLAGHRGVREGDVPPPAEGGSL